MTDLDYQLHADFIVDRRKRSNNTAHLSIECRTRKTAFALRLVMKATGRFSGVWVYEITPVSKMNEGTMPGYKRITGN